MKKILIVGGGENQMPLIESAKSEDYFVIVADIAGEKCPAYGVADIIYDVSTRDKEAILEVAQKEKIDGIISNSEPSMHMVTWVADKMGLAGNPVEGIEALMSKIEFRKLQKELGLYCPQSYVACNFEDVEDDVKHLSFPIIIKPCECSGSRGTTKVSSYNHEEIDNAFSVCKDFSRNGLVTVEEFVEMYSLTTIEGEVFVYTDEILWDGLFSTTRASFAPMVPMSYSIPLRLADDRMELIKTSLTKIFKATGIRFGEFNIEGYFTKNYDFFIVEINVRQGGHHLPDFVYKNTNIDMTKLLVTLAVGDESYWNQVKEIPRKYQSAVRHIVFSRQTGIFDSLIIDDSIKEYVTCQQLLVNKGDKVMKCEKGSDAIAIVDILFPSIEVGHQLYDKLESLISVKLEDLLSCKSLI